ncbi:MAG: hypothetical protein M1486_01545 [Gammaproteobacteria bacterium]|nr:hypothetical protein [Gammaproteobacteria bacterium]
MKFKSVFVFIAYFLSISVCNSVLHAKQVTPSGVARTFFSGLWGKPSPSQIIFLPIGFHFFNNSDDHNNEQWLIALNYKGYIGGTFVNSASRRVVFAGVERQVYQRGKLSIDYLLAIMQGYKGEGLSHLGPTLSHDPGPLVSLTATWSLTHHLAINLATYGVGGLAGVSYYF